MNKETVKKLLERFYEGLTTAEEEQQLRAFFSGEAVPPEMEADRELFLALAKEGEETAPPELQEKLTGLIDEHYAGAEHSGTVSLPAWVLRTVPLAATLIVVLATYFFLLSRKPRDTYSDPQTAYLEARKALMLVSRNFNKGTRNLSYLREISLPASEMNKLGNTVGKLEHLPYIRLMPSEPGSRSRQEKKQGENTEENKNK